MVRRRAFIARCLALGAGAAAVGPAPPAAARGAPRSPRRGGVLKHIGIDAATFDVQASAAAETRLISSFVRRTLFRLSPDRRAGTAVAPDLAVRAEASPDGQTYILTLRRGVRWENRPPVGDRELTAADVRYTLERALERSPHAAALLGPVQAIDAPGPHEVRVRLAEPFAPFLPNLADPALAILAPEAEGARGDPRAPGSLVGCGPFVLERYEPGAKAVFARNPGYYRRGRPYLDRVEWIFVRDRATQLSLLRAGQVDVAAPDGRIDRAEIAELDAAGGALSRAWWEPFAVRQLALRVDRAPFGDPRARRALSLAVDRRGWLARRLDGQGSEGQGPVPAAMREWLVPARELGEGARYLGHDPAAARRLLAEAGHAGGLKLVCAPAPGLGPEASAELDWLADGFRVVGVDLHRAAPGQAEDATWGPWPTHAEVDRHLEGAFRSRHPENRSRVADRALDALLDAQRRATATAARRRAIAELQRHVAERVYHVYTPTPRSLAAWTPRVKGYVPTDSLDRGAQLEAVWVDEP